MQPSPYAGPSAAPPVAPARPVLRPSGWWYVAAAAIGVVGLGVAMVVLVRGVVTMNDTIDDFDRAPIPATLTVDIVDPGGYTIYHEVENGPSSSYLWGDPDVRVTGPDGVQVALDRYDTDVTYNFRGHDGQALYSFSASQAGTYTVDAAMLTATRYGVDLVAVGPGVGADLVVAIVTATAIGLLSCVAGAVVAIVVGVRRGRSRRAQMPVPPVPGYGPPPPPGYGAPGGWAPPGGWGPPGRAAPTGWGGPPPGQAAPSGWDGPPPAGKQPPPPGGAWGPVGSGPQDAPPRADAPRDGA